MASFKVNIAQTNIGYIPPLPKSIMALNISFNPIYDFDQGVDLTFSPSTFHSLEATGDRNKLTEVHILKSKKDAFLTQSLDDNHFVILIMRNTSLQTLPEGWDKSLQDLEDWFLSMTTELT